MINYKELLNLPKLSRHDSFAFGCNMCGACCRERDDVLLTPLDLFRIAKYLNKPILDIINEYCETYEGRDSKIPIIRIKPREYRKTCPFSKGRCQIYSSRPTVCRLYPLGRMTSEDTGELSYFLQSVSCGNKYKTQTVQEWIQDDFSNLADEDFTILWHGKIHELSKLLRNLYDSFTGEHSMLYSALLHILYIAYETKQDFISQFQKNSDSALKIVRAVVEKFGKIG